MGTTPNGLTRWYFGLGRPAESWCLGCSISATQSEVGRWCQWVVGCQSWWIVQDEFLCRKCNTTLVHRVLQHENKNCSHNSVIQAISNAPLLVHYYSEALPTQHSTDTVPAFHAKTPQATVSKGLARAWPIHRQHSPSGPIVGQSEPSEPSANDDNWWPVCADVSWWCYSLNSPSHGL